MVTRYTSSPFVVAAELRNELRCATGVCACVCVCVCVCVCLCVRKRLRVCRVRACSCEVWGSVGRVVSRERLRIIVPVVKRCALRQCTASTCARRGATRTQRRTGGWQRSRRQPPSCQSIRALTSRARHGRSSVSMRVHWLRACVRLCVRPRVHVFTSPMSEARALSIVGVVVCFCERRCRCSCVQEAAHHRRRSAVLDGLHGSAAPPADPAIQRIQARVCAA